MFLLVFAMLLNSSVFADTPRWYEYSADNEPVIDLYFFWSERCPHCLRARPDVLRMSREFTWLRLHDLELTRHPDHVQTYIDMAQQLDQSARSVPAFLFCGHMQTGYGDYESTGMQLRQQLTQCYQQIRGGNLDLASLDFNHESIDLPLLGEINLQHGSLLMLTLVLGGMDAFNPCAFFVLLFLLSMLVHANSRGKMLVVGGVFVFTSGLMYFLFMAAWFNLFRIVGSISWITSLAGIVAITIALLNIKDYFHFHQGPSLSIPDGAKPGLFERMRHLLGEKRIVFVLLATMLLAIAANSYELLCTAGFPMVYTRLLTLRELGIGEYYVYLLLYNLVYILPLLLIVLLFVYRMGARKLTEHEGRVLKLLSGYMMLLLGVLLLFDAQLIQNLVSAAGLLVFAILLTWLTHRFSLGRH